MISQITNIVYQNAWPSQNGGPDGNMHTSLVYFADGKSGTVNHKNQTPPYRIGDTQNYEVVGDFRGTPKLKVTRPAQPGAQQPQQPQYNPPPTQPQPQYQPPAQNPGNRQQSPFLNGLNRLALLWCHCWNKSGEISGKVGGLTPEQRQSACASLFIEANKNGIGALPLPALTASQPAPQPQTQYQPPPPRPEQRAGNPAGPDGQAFPPPQENIDEDVPF